MYYVYILYSDKLKQFYIGYTKNFVKRLEHHNLGLDRWSKRGVSWRLVYKESFTNKPDALRRERFLKSGKGREFIHAEVAKVVTARV